MHGVENDAVRKMFKSEISDLAIGIATLRTAMMCDVEEEVVRRVVVGTITLLAGEEDMDPKKYIAAFKYVSKATQVPVETVYDIVGKFALILEARRKRKTE